MKIKYIETSLPTVEQIETQATFIDVFDLEEIASTMKPRPKKYLYPAIFATDGVVLVDIDHIEEHFDTIVDHLDEITRECPCVVLVKQSYSKSLHFICNGHWSDADEYAKLQLYYMACLAKVILKVTGIDLRDVSGALDLHSRSISQRLFVYDRPTWRGVFGQPIVYDERAFDEYPSLRPQNSASKRIITDNVSNLYAGEFKALKRDKITVNKKFEVAGFTGNDLRWRIANAVFYLYKGNMMLAKQFVKNNFTNYKEFSFSSVTTRGHNSNVVQWILDNYSVDGTIEQENRKERVIREAVESREIVSLQHGYEVRGYLDNEYHELILESIMKYHRLCIKGGTGIGKTVAVMNIAKELKALVLTPFNDMRFNYTAKLKLVEHGKDYDGGGCVMVYDQFVTVPSYKLYNSVIFIDESHVMFMDRSYRDRLIRLMEKIKELGDKVKIVYVSATPLEEINDVEKTLEFWKKRPVVNMHWMRVSNSKKMLAHIACTKQHDYSRVVIFSDYSARWIYDSAVVSGLSDKIHMLHSDYKSTGDIDNILETGLLSKELTIGTSLVYNGFNFNNKDERILVVYEFIPNESMAWQIIQCIGRLRNSIVDLIVVEGNQHNRIASLKERREKADIYYKVDNSVFKSDERLRRDDVYRAVKFVEEYITEHGTVENVKNELNDTGYIKMIDEVDRSIDTERVVNPLKKQVDKKVRSLYSKGVYELVSDNKKEIEYFNDIVSRLRDIEDTGIDRELLCRVINSNPAKSISTLLDNLDRILNLICITDDNWNSQVSRLNEEVSKLSEGWTKKQIVGDIKTNSRIRDKYIVYSSTVDVINEYCRVEEELFNSRNENSSKGGTNKAISVVVTNTQTGESHQFSSRGEATKWIGCSSDTYDKIVLGQSKKYSHITVR